MTQVEKGRPKMLSLGGPNIKIHVLSALSPYISVTMSHILWGCPFLREIFPDISCDSVVPPLPFKDH